MVTLKGSRTEINVVTAFAGESQARNRYTYAASVAKKQGFVKISQIFEETANQEKEHAKKLFKFLDNDQEVNISAAYPAFGVPEDTKVHLAHAAAGEHYEHTEMYPGFAAVAREEGFNDVAATMVHIAVAEKYHEDRFNEYLNELKHGTFFKSEVPIVWRCLNCGYIHEGTEPPKMCPACAHPIDHFESLFNVVKPSK